jgi:PAS domain S-box-containing protein
MPTSQARLLLVDDDAAAIQIMGRMLAQYPDQRFATTGEAALRLARESRPDLILLDAEMPGTGGLAVCKALKADPALARVPVIFVTAHDTPALQVAALQEGAADFVTKPLVASQITARVRAQLRNTRDIERLHQPPLAAGAVTQPRPAARPARLLIVDDDTVSIHMLHNTLADIGSLYFAKTGAQAQQLARELLPDLILLDAHMPGLDGFDVCRSLKAEPAFRHVPIVFVTRFTDPRYETRALDLGAADFVAKPYSAAVLQARVRNLLELKRRTDEELHAVLEQGRQLGDARIADIVAAASDAIVTYDAWERIVLINAAACRLFGVEKQGVLGAPAQALLGAALAHEVPALPGVERTTLARADGSRFPIEMSVSRVGEGAQRLTTAMLRDISDRERFEAESRSRLQAEAANQAKSTMMACIAHEMGNPLNGVLGMAGLMAADLSHPLPPAQSQRLQHIVTSGHSLQQLMRDVIELGRSGSGALAVALQPLDVAACVEAALADVAPQAAQAGILLSSDGLAPSARAMADGGRLQQCLVNLLSNAIKYGRPGGWVRVRVAAQPEVEISVSDNGIGIHPAQQAHLFEPFNRLGRQTTSTAGVGLGLVITRQLVEAMHGRLQLQSTPHQGSCFTIVLPRAASPPARAGGAP